MFAGQPFHCAVTYFPGDNLSKAEGKALEEVPHCSGCPAGKVIHCASGNELSANDLLLIRGREAKAL